MRYFLIIISIFISFLSFGQNDNLKLKLKKQKHLLNLPSASGVEIIDGDIYIIGDDTPYLYKLNQDFIVLEKYSLSGNDSTINNRVPGSIKGDFESMAAYKKGGYPYLAVLSSGSMEVTRDTVHVFALSEKKLIASKNVRPLFELIREKANFTTNNEINIEAFAIGKRQIYLMQRGNNNMNMLIRINKKEFLNYIFKEDSGLPEVEIQNFKLPVFENTLSGFSGACMLKDGSGILFTASLETAENAYSDGEILGSYVGLIKFNKNSVPNISTVMLKNGDKPIKTKLEGISIISAEKGVFNLISVSDNDDGTSIIYNLELNTY